MLQVRYLYHLSNIECDIISLNLSEDLKFTPKKDNVLEAISKGIFFEISYANLMDTMKRRRLIKNGRYLTSICEGKNLIITSEVDDYIKHKSPLEVKTISSLFGIKQEYIHKALTDNCKVLLHNASKILSTSIENKRMSVMSK